jgi:hypothetical protein
MREKEEELEEAKKPIRGFEEKYKKNSRILKKNYAKMLITNYTKI